MADQVMAGENGGGDVLVEVASIMTYCQASPLARYFNNEEKQALQERIEELLRGSGEFIE